MARKNVRRLALVGGVAALSLLSAGVAAAETLAYAITLAYQTNPTLQRQRAQVRALDENYVQVRAGYRPQISVDASLSYRDSGGVRSRSSGADLGVTQPIYTGGRVSASLRAVEADILSARESLRSVEQSVLNTVVTAYVDVRRDQQSLLIRQDNVAVLRRQLDESNARFEVGEITRTDVAQAQARLSLAQALLATAQAQLSISRSAYAAAVGQNPGELAQEPALVGLPATPDQAFDQAQENNPSVTAAEYAEQASRARVAAARAETRPSVGARAGLGASGGGVSGGGSGFTTIDPVTGLPITTGGGGGSGFFSGYETALSAGLTATIPLFTGGQVSSRIRQQIETNNVDRISVEVARRDVLNQVSSAYNLLLSRRANITSNEEQVRANRIAFEGVQQEAQVGLRTTLDVLNAQQELRDSELLLVNARRDEYVSGTQLLAAVGALSPAALSATVDVYDPKQSFDRIKGANAVPWEGVVEALDQVAAPTIERRPTDDAEVIPTARP